MLENFYWIVKRNGNASIKYVKMSRTSPDLYHDLHQRNACAYPIVKRQSKMTLDKNRCSNRCEIDERDKARFCGNIYKYREIPISRVERERLG